MPAFPKGCKTTTSAFICSNNLLDVKPRSDKPIPSTTANESLETESRQTVPKTPPPRNKLSLQKVSFDGITFN
uniref:Uncharacterized protein n=1 Tax=Panagrellus redivivus TaxID=6233 RepID=A0A7E4W4T9_PANRE